MDSLKEEIAAIAARLVVEEGLEYGGAKRRAVKQLGLPERTALPDNALIEAQVEDYIALFCADTQPQELRALRELALRWMERLQAYRPHVGGAVWHGTATRRSDIFLQLFCDDSKAAEIGLIDLGVRFEASQVTGFTGDLVDALSIQARCPGLDAAPTAGRATSSDVRVRTTSTDNLVGVHLLVYDFDDLRGALKPDARGRRPRADTATLRALLQDQTP